MSSARLAKDKSLRAARSEDGGPNAGSCSWRRGAGRVRPRSRRTAGDGCRREHQQNSEADAIENSSDSMRVMYFHLGRSPCAASAGGREQGPLGGASEGGIPQWTQALRRELRKRTAGGLCRKEIVNLLPYLVGFFDLIWQVQELHHKATHSKVISACSIIVFLCCDCCGIIISVHNFCVVIGLDGWSRRHQMAFYWAPTEKTR